MRAESTPIEAICSRTGKDLASGAALTKRGGLGLGAGARSRLVTGELLGLGTGIDVVPGTGCDDGSTRAVVETLGATAALGWLEQPAAPMVTVASNAATVTITDRRASGG